ncbi:MAG: sigma-54-dependent Fis family transcriptional regulator [Flexistipes sinusarabici]|uniref:Sigma-54-dependent Fis family transcriptional regulator n=1 Tax=Flexistipes sinusarabici TaxID=2352 RepID=A0A5D0MGY1_FLESI|nr:sigma-54 dependent transcriptional regulator [Flexistipes sinusarabici]TYB32974.1 MAG: sigma-54-dependent Fis family transcriptional regulator [Flexistipes sinusarabici]
MNILLIEDNESLAMLIRMMLEDEGYEITYCSRGDSALEKFEKGKFDIIITDVKLPGVNGHEILHRVLSDDPDALVIVITAYGNISDAVKSIKAGAFDYIAKPFENEDLLHTVNKAARYKELKQENTNLKNYVRDSLKPQIIGNSRKMQEVLNLVGKVANTEAPVLLLGESGTGKELVAREIHFRSMRNNNPFVSINCAAIPENLFESELFGHKKGAFTGADRDKKGKITQANKGTIFLDEIGELPMDSLQAKLLRFLQEKEIEPVGSSSVEKVDVRVIAATNRNLAEMVRKNTFREDLYYRLNVFPLEIPPLRERKDDLQSLCDFFLKKYGFKNAVLDKEILQKLSAYNWPGNVRELDNIIYRMTILSKNGQLDPSVIPGSENNDIRSCLDLDLPDDYFDLVNFEKNIILRALEKFDGNKTQVAKYLCIPRHVLLYRLEKYGIKD